MKSACSFILFIIVLLAVVSCEKTQDPVANPYTPPPPPPPPPAPNVNPFVGKYSGVEDVYVLSHILPPHEAAYAKTIEVYEENGQTIAKDDSIQVVLNADGYFEHNPLTTIPSETYTYIVEIKGDSLFKHLNKFTGRLWVFHGLKQK